MRILSEKQSDDAVPVHFPRPGERYVRVEDLMKDSGVREQIRDMAKLGEHSGLGASEEADAA